MEDLLGVIESKPGLRIDPETRIQDLNKDDRIQYDLYRVPFNNGRGGTARKMRCNTESMNSWHSLSPRSRWLVFASKVNTPYTELFLPHMDKSGNDSPPILLSRLSSEGLAVNVPQFVNIDPDDLEEIRLADF
jgi:hypothetical protein